MKKNALKQIEKRSQLTMNFLKLPISGNQIASKESYSIRLISRKNYITT